MRKASRALLVAIALAMSAVSVNAVIGHVKPAQAVIYYDHVYGDHSFYSEPHAVGYIGTAKDGSKFDWHNPGPGWWAYGYSHSLKRMGWIEVRFLGD